jgi:predicted N-acetyltransferase YhbS
MYEIRPEQAEDWWDVESLLDLSFAPGREALSSYRLRDGVPRVPELCLVARDSDGILGGAIRFWPIQIGENQAQALLLGPIAVHPTRQGEGLGGQLIRSALELARQSGWERVILVGDAPYYGRFGFKKADFLQYPPPTNPDRLLYLALSEGAFDGVTGMISRGRQDTN